MTGDEAAWAGVPARLRPALTVLAAEDAPPNVVLMKLIIDSVSAAEIEAALDAMPAPVGRQGGERVAEVRALLRARPGAFAIVKSVIAEAAHDAVADTAENAVESWAGIFDRLAKAAPEAGVALYGLGSPELLAQATGEVIARMQEWGLVRPDLDCLEIGCGSGRFVAALSPLVASVLGLDVSAGMISEARKRCVGLTNVRLEQSSGHDLSAIPDASLDTVLAADVFPYLVAAGGEVARRHVQECARVLRPNGALLILNYSYRGDVSADRGELAAHLDDAGFVRERHATRDLKLWDAPTFLARRRVA